MEKLQILASENVEIIIVHTAWGNGTFHLTLKKKAEDVQIEVGQQGKDLNEVINLAFAKWRRLTNGTEVASLMIEHVRPSDDIPF